MTRRRHQQQGGYALIFVFALAAMLSLALYVEMPRLALEMQRNREEMLIERGEQYARAIKVFVRKNTKYPQTVEELESFNGKRRDECLNQHWFLSLRDAQFHIERWRREYNTARPHQQCFPLTPSEYTQTFVSPTARLSA